MELGGRYSLRSRKRSFQSTDEANAMGEEEQILPPRTKRANRRSTPRGRHIVKTEECFLMENNQMSELADSGQGTAVGFTSVQDTSEEPFASTSKACQSKNMDVMIDTPPASVKDETNLDGMEEDLPFTREDTPIYFEENKLLYKLHRERLNRSGGQDLYKGYKDGYQASSKPWA